ADRGELLRSGIKVAIVGRPNVGKSSLLNAWSRSDRAIVTDLPGTTRDVVESRLVVGGIPVQVLDTAGIRETEDVVEQLGVARSRDAALEADLVILAIDGAAGWCEEDDAIYRQVSDRPMVVVVNKVDLLSTEADGDEPVGLPEGVKGGAIAIVETAAAKNQGIDQLETALIRAATRHQIQATDLDLAINQRQAAALTRAQVALARVGETLTNQLPLDFWTIDLRDAVYALGEITGEEVTESVLGRIFSRFCIGK
ncbi:MAG: GTPase, partial [Cyanobacteria bacterium P01_H01_bin.130]